MELKPGYKQTEVGVIPEDWNINSLASVTPRNAGNGIVDGPFGSNLKTIHYRKSGIPIITSGYVTEGRFAADTYLYVDKEKFEQEKRSAVRPGDIVMAKIGARCGASAILPEWHQIGILSGNAMKITVDTTRHSAFYVWQVLWGLYSTDRIEPLKTVGAQPAISMANLKKYKIATPPLPEQRAIAAALSDVDALIGALDRLIAKKRDIKQAAMQQLLTGQARLPGFSGEWEVKRLGEIAQLKNGYAFKSSTYTILGQFKVVTIANVQDGYMNTSECNKIAAIPQDIQSHQKLHRGDILISMTGNVGRVCRVSDDDCLLNQRVGKLESLGVDDAFLFFLLNQRQFFVAMTGKAKGGAQGNLGVSDISEFQFSLPSSLPEQTAIAAVLSDMNAEIAALEQRRDKTRALKRGMMQELLTGRTRLV